MQRFAAVGLTKIELPGGATIRLSEGAEFIFGGELYAPRDATYGRIGGAEAIEEGIGNQVPALQLTLLTPSTTAAADLVQPGYQTARVRAWLAEYDPDTQAIIDAGDPVFDGFLDQAVLERGPDSFELSLSVVSLLERVFELNIGNALSDAYHQSIWPGELGEAHATGLGLADAWGTDSPVPVYAEAGGGGGGGPSWRGSQNVNYA